MSLFQAREWWSVKPDDQEETGQGNLIVANIDNDVNEHVKIVTASYSGFLRIYYPRQATYKIDDLLLEKNLELPILQIAAGRFLPTANKLGICVLHPRKLVVFSIQNIKEKGSSDTSYYQLVPVFEHKLDRTSYNFCHGPFGGVQGKDYICVQSMDGQLQVFEHQNFSFSRYLNNFLVPGPFCYVPKIDSFVTVNASMTVECYKYQVLASASENKIDNKDAHGLNSTKKVHVDWSLNIGEHVVDMFVARFSHTLSATQGDIVVVGEHTLFTVKEQGTIRMQKRLDYNPSFACVYDDGTEGGNGFQNMLVGTYQNSIMVYKDSRLAWAARTLDAPVGLAVGAFGGIKGFIVMMTDTCHVTVSYLGTDPPNQSANASADKDLNYEAMDEEHKTLLKVIRQASTDTMVEPSEKLTLRVQVPNSLSTGLDRAVYEDAADHAKEDGQYLSVVVKLFVSYSGKEDLEDINISILAPEAFRPDKNSILLSSLRGGSRTPLALDIRFRVSTTAIPNSLNVDVVAAFVTKNNEPRTAQTNFRLPMCLASRVVTPLKNCQYMFTLDTNRPPPPLSELFEDILTTAMATNPDVKRTASNVMTVMYYGREVDVTILVSKKSGRYRLQSGCFEALALMTEEVVDRLNKFFKGMSDFQILFKELVPLEDFFNIIDKHHSQRTRLGELRQKLENQAQQYRVIQKRLLVRFKDKNPAPLQGLDVLHHDTYNHLIDMGSDMAHLKQELKMSGNSLACAIQLMLLLIKFKYNLTEEDGDLLACYLSPHVNDTDDQGWEERTDASMTHLLRTTLAKNARDAANVAQPLAPLKDTSKLKRHIQIVCERLGKGLTIGDGDTKAKPKPPTAADTAAKKKSEPAVQLDDVPEREEIERPRKSERPERLKEKSSSLPAIQAPPSPVAEEDIE